MPHISLAMQNEGDVCVCNKNTDSLKDNKHNKIYLHQHGLEAAWNSYTRKVVAAGLDNGKRIPGCQACWNDEDAGKQSSRQFFNATFAEVSPSKEQPKVLIIKPGNTCNLGCRMCMPATSTSLYQDFYKLDVQRNKFTGTFKEYTKQFETVREGFRKDNNLIWEPFERWLPNLAFLDIYGGEPMLAPAMWDRMRAVVDAGNSKDIPVQFHTNATIWNDDYIQLLPKFKSVNIGLSLDSHIKEQLEYIRHGVVAETVFENVKRYKQLAEQHKNITLKITCTVTVYNVFYIDEIFTGLSKLGIPVFLSPVYSPEHYDIRHLPGPIKSLLLRKFNIDPSLNIITKLLIHTVPGCDIEWPRFCEEVELLDAIRNQSFLQTFPEWGQILEGYIKRRSLW